MARKWSGFVAQNLATKEEWHMLEACETLAKRAELAPERSKSPAARASFKRRTAAALSKDK